MRLFLVFLFLLEGLVANSQSSHFSNALKVKLSEKNNPNVLYTVFVQGDIAKLKTHEKEGAYTLNYSSGNIASIRCNAAALSYLITNKIISYAELPQPKIRPLNDTMVYRNRIKPVKLGAVPLNQPYNGSGIVLGFIDTGIDIAHGDFKDAQGNTRIKFLWDQVATVGPTVPSPYNYGIEWTDADINANQCTHSDMPHFGHGTQVAGIGAGNGLANNTHEGCASKADIIMVAQNFNLPGSTADAVQYIFNKATLLSKPCVINASVGDYYGSHDGTDLEAKLIESMLVNIPGRVMVAAVGNAGHVKFHTKTQCVSNDTSFTWLTNNQSQIDYWFYGDTMQIKNLQISIGANRTNYSDLGRISFKNYNYGLNTIQYDTLKHNGNRIGIIQNSSSINNYGVYEMYVHIDADTNNLLWRIETKGSGTHHAWNFDFVSSGLPTLSQYPKMAYYIAPDTMYSMVSSYQCSDEVITVGNYVNLKRYYDVNDTLRTLPETAGALFGTSSSGPTRDGRIKPDINATGHAVFTALVTGMQANLITNAPQVVAQGSLHVRGGGSSAASPVVAGLAALYLEAHPLATNQQVKTAITQCAFSDFYTGTVPNYAWGYGKLDGLAAMTCGENLVGIKNISRESINYFPNPFNDVVSIETPTPLTGKIYVYSTDGKLMLQEPFQGKTHELNFSKLTSSYSTLYLIQITGEEKNYSFKLIRNP
ncbi:S8 family serine peptidase [Aurantibacillus circumpalustris]|uniref:S8 family serine peptidase n=1 Tax=Aurantibacillus circumpalustris TaxID=3036359 RepID=UPI00295AD4BD|nr:S8 family serine peptidase [Aurantibacillus circumpalustris]